MKPHRHAEILRAIADGKEIQILAAGPKAEWTDWKEGTHWNPLDEHGCQYRIKPEPPKYPQTKMRHTELIAVRGIVGYELEKIEPNSLEAQALERIANAAIARAIEDGDVVPKIVNTKEVIESRVSGFRDGRSGYVREDMLEKVAIEAWESARAYPEERIPTAESPLGKVIIDNIIEAVKQGK